MVIIMLIIEQITSANLELPLDAMVAPIPIPKMNRARIRYKVIFGVTVI
jgi:hypothetical protein